MPFFHKLRKPNWTLDLNFYIVLFFSPVILPSIPSLIAWLVLFEGMDSEILDMSEYIFFSLVVDAKALVHLVACQPSFIDRDKAFEFVENCLYVLPFQMPLRTRMPSKPNSGGTVKRRRTVNLSARNGSMRNGRMGTI